MAITIAVETVYGIRYTKLATQDTYPTSFTRSYGQHLQNNVIGFFHKGHEEEHNDFDVNFDSDSCKIVQNSNGTFCIFVPDSLHNVVKIFSFMASPKKKTDVIDSKCKTRIVNFCGKSVLESPLDKEVLKNIIINKKLVDFGCIYEVSSCKGTISIQSDMRTLLIKGAKKFSETIHDIKVLTNENDEDKININAHMIILSCGLNRNIKISNTCLIKTYFERTLNGLCSFVQQHDESPNKLEITGFDLMKLFEVDLIRRNIESDHIMFANYIQNIMVFTCTISKNAEFLFCVGFKSPVRWTLDRERILKDICDSIAELICSVSDGFWARCIFKS